ncbi:MAG TPA: ABC transporter transmembrane domain-containing protein [Tepidisphaeraceae bacterium]|nr:ABC transporter transmembrane domain-containing protein [Tepidisphaeraceae bacterium]
MSLEDRSSLVVADSAERKPRDKGRKKEKGVAHFWRACGFLYPYRGMVVVSILCAVFVSAANTAGMGTLLPIMRVLVKHDTIATWADREIAQRRLGVKFSNDTRDLMIVSVEAGRPASVAGLKEQDALVAPPGNTRADMATLLAKLSTPGPTRATLIVRDGGPRTLALAPLPWYLAAARNLAARWPTQPVKAIAMVFAVIAALAISSNIVKFFQEYLSDKSAVLTVNDIRRRLYDRVLHVPLSHFNLRGTSDVTSRLTQDSQGLGEGFKMILGQSIQEPVKAAMMFSLAVFISWKLTLFIVFFAPLMLVFIKKFGKKMRRASKKALISSSQMLGQIEGSLAGIRVVKGANAERFERRRYTRIMDKLVEEQLRMSRIDSFSEPTMETLTLFVIASVVLVASYMMLIAPPTLTFDRFIIVMACLASIGDSLRRLSKVNNVMEKANAAAARIFEVMDLPIEKKEWGSAPQAARPDSSTTPAAGNGRPASSRNGANSFSSVPAPSDPFSLSRPTVPPAPVASSRPRIKLGPVQRNVSFENITFSYPNAPSPVLMDVSLTIPRGRCVAIVGRNGSGKTTLLALLPRFYDPQAGRVLIDGIDVRQVTLKSLREQISIVTQDSVIFPGTVADNIAYGNPLMPRDQIIAAAKRAFAHEFILDKPQGYDTLLGELGGQLSGGQKQRICIARAILRKSPILILDEATSQVDAESEALIQQAIEGLMHERTTFVIAHRFSTILGADEIIVMDKGRIVGQGRHEELLGNCETYQQLYERQLIAAPAA